MSQRVWMALAAVLAVSGAGRAQDDEHKNVKLLTGLDALEMQRTMNFMRASLGVHCDFCHVVTEKDGWQWERDDKEAKVTARRMIAMVQELNRGSFEGRTAVSCFTCHGGHRRPQSLPPLPQPAPPFPTVTKEPPPPDPPTAEAVWRRFREATRLAARPATRVLKGQHVGAGESTPLEIHEKGDRVLIVATTPKGPLVQALDGGEGWISRGGKTRPMKAGDRARAREIRDALAFPPDEPRGGRIVARESVDGRDTWVLEWTPSAGRTERLHFDVESGLLLRRAAFTRRTVGVVPERIDYTDYRPVGAAIVPATYKTAYVDPWTGATRTFTDVKLGVAVDDAVFARPPQ
jgi:hypothetical protein